MTIDGTEGLTALQRLVKDKLAAGDLSYRAAAGHSHGLIDHSAIHQIATGRMQGNLSEKAIAGLALALQCSPREVEDAIEETLRPKRFMELSRRLAGLPAEKQAELIDMIEQVLNEHSVAESTTRKRRRPPAS